MGAFRVGFFDQTAANFAGKEFRIVIGLFAELLRHPVFGAEHGDGAREVVAFQSKFCLDGVFKRLGQIFGRVKHTAIVDVGDVHHELVVFELGLWRLNCDASLASNASNRHLGNSTQKSVAGRVFGRRIHCSSHDFSSGVAAFATGSEVGRQFTAAKIGKHG